MLEARVFFRRLQFKWKYSNIALPVVLFLGWEARREFAEKQNSTSARFKGLDGQIILVERASEAEPVEEAKKIIRKLLDNDGCQARKEEQTAATILEGTGISLLEAVSMVATFHQKLKTMGGSLGEAVEHYLQKHEGTPITVAKLVENPLIQKSLAATAHHVNQIHTISLRD